MHTHQIVAFDKEIMLTDSTTVSSISFYSSSTLSKGKTISDEFMPSLWICTLSFPLRLWKKSISGMHFDDRAQVLDLLYCGRR